MTPRTGLDPARTKFVYEWAADRYLRSLPLEHYIEATSQATQREITLESFALVHAKRPDIQVFNELLVQYPPPGGDPDQPPRVVPDNMVIVYPGPIQAKGSFNTPLQPVGPFLILEYVLRGSRRKAYDDNFKRYERDLKVPYYLHLLFYPDNEELTVFRLVGEKYTAVTPNALGRLPIPELEMEAALLNGWVRFWFRGELLPLPAELLRERDTERRARFAAERQVESERETRLVAEQRAEFERRARLAMEAEMARMREELARAKGRQ